MPLASAYRLLDIIVESAKSMMIVVAMAMSVLAGVQSEIIVASPVNLRVIALVAMIAKM